MELYGVVPQVIDANPAHDLLVHYPNGARVDQGNELTPDEVSEEPKLEWPVEQGAHYALCMTDPDVPSGETLHWLVVNIPGNDVKQGQVLVPYFGALCTNESETHRFVLMVYKQPGPLTCDEPRVSDRAAAGAIDFSNRKFAAKYNLGHPVAGNMFHATTLAMRQRYQTAAAPIMRI